MIVLSIIVVVCFWGYLIYNETFDTKIAINDLHRTIKNQIVCRNCDNKRSVECKGCDGTANPSCNGCKGSGKMVCRYCCM